MEPQASHLVQPIFFADNRVRRDYRGGDLLCQFVGEPGHEDGEFPEDWLASTVQPACPADGVEEGLARVLDADGHPGPTMRDLLATHGEAVLGPEHVARFGNHPAILCKYLDAASRQPVQCFPAPDDAASPDAGGWFILGTREIDQQPPHVLVGLRKDASGGAFAQAMAERDDEAMAAMLHRIPVSPGQAFYLPPGMPHAVGPGCFVLAMQNAVTLAEGDGPSADALDLEGRDKDELLQQVRIQEHLLHRSDEGFTAEVFGSAQTEGFTLWRAEIAGRLQLHLPRAFAVVLCVAGQGRIHWASGSRDLRCGEYFFQPYGVPWVEYVAQKRMSLLLAMPPTP